MNGFIITRKTRYLVRGLGLIFIGSFLFYMSHILISPTEVSINTSGSSGYVTTQYYDEKFDYTKLEFIARHPVNTGSPSILMLSIVANPNSYGKGRSFVDFLTSLLTFSIRSYNNNLALLVSDREEFNKIHHYLLENQILQFNKITLILSPFIEETNTFDRKYRHDDKLQRLRRRLIARVRNFLLFNSLGTEQYTVFFDSDIVEIKLPEMISVFVESNLDIIAPRVQWGDTIDDYDRNSWRGERTKPSPEQLEQMDNNDWDNWDYVPSDVKSNIFHFFHWTHESNSEVTKLFDQLNFAVPLDSVGGAVLFAKSIISKQGVQFPASYIVGTTWDRLEGYDGIETEGVCYLAKPLGYECWGMPNLVAIHSTD